MLDSIHVARWLKQFKQAEVSFYLFPSSPMRRLHPEIVKLLENSGRATFQLSVASRFALPLWFADRLCQNFLRGMILRRWVEKVRPDYVHLIEMQHAGYIGIRAFNGLRPESFKLITTNYGSDIFWFRRYKSHARKIAVLLTMSHYYSAECARDYELAKELGFTGGTLPLIPNAGGVISRSESVDLKKNDERNLVAVKGYQGWSGRAISVLDAIETIAEELKDFEIVVFSSNPIVRVRALIVSVKTGLRITSFGKGRLSHNEVRKLLSSSRIYVGASRSDGISTTMLEAMASGAIPVQTSTACCSEWFSDSGIAMDGFSVSTISESIRAGLKLSKNEENRDSNFLRVLDQASSERVTPIALSFYGL